MTVSVSHRAAAENRWTTAAAARQHGRCACDAAAFRVFVDVGLCAGLSRWRACCFGDAADVRADVSVRPGRRHSRDMGGFGACDMAHRHATGPCVGQRIVGPRGLVCRPLSGAGTWGAGRVGRSGGVDEPGGDGAAGGCVSRRVDDRASDGRAGARGGGRAGRMRGPAFRGRRPRSGDVAAVGGLGGNCRRRGVSTTVLCRRRLPGHRDPAERRVCRAGGAAGPVVAVDCDLTDEGGRVGGRRGATERDAVHDDVRAGDKPLRCSGGVDAVLRHPGCRRPAGVGVTRSAARPRHRGGAFAGCAGLLAEREGVTPTESARSSRRPPTAASRRCGPSSLRGRAAACPCP